MNAQLSPASTNPELDAFWMPFTANRQFKAAPRLLARAEGMYYWTNDGREVLDGVAGLWCVNAGHGRREITDAVTKQLNTMEFAPTFQMGHPIAFELANRLAKIAPPGLDRIFFTNSGSESVDTALKIAIAYHRARGAGQARTTSAIASSSESSPSCWPRSTAAASTARSSARRTKRHRAASA